MSAYIIAEIDVRDSAAYEDYKKLVPASIEKYGGRYLARGGKTEVLEGNWNPKRIVILEFDSVERAKEWLDCPEYCEAKQIRHRAAISNLIVVEGLN